LNSAYHAMLVGGFREYCRSKFMLNILRLRIGKTVLYVVKKPGST
jgi:hypothetical protein